MALVHAQGTTLAVFQAQIGHERNMTANILSTETRDTPELHDISCELARNKRTFGAGSRDR